MMQVSAEEAVDWIDTCTGAVPKLDEMQNWVKTGPVCWTTTVSFMSVSAGDDIIIVHYNLFLINYIVLCLSYDHDMPYYHSDLINITIVSLNALQLLF